MTRIYRNPFAFNGDKVDIAESSQPDGRISIEDGWTTDYELPEGEPNYKPVERDEMNGIFNEVTQAVGEIQLNGFPVWQSLPGGWPSLAIVRHGNDVWRSTKDSNGSTPGVNADWASISFLSPGDALLAKNNLSDIDNAATARSNLGLGSAATAAMGTSDGEIRTNTQNDARFLAKGTGAEQGRTNTQNDNRFLQQSVLGAGSDQVRTNSQNDDRFLNLTSNQVIVTNKTWERPSDSINGLYIRYTGEGVDGSYMDFGITDYSLLNDWPEMPSGGTNIVRFRRGGTRGDKNIDGFAVGSGDGRPSLLVHASSGVVLGNPSGGLKGRGSINSESSYVNNAPVLVEGDYGVGVPVGPFLSDFHSVDVDNGFYSWSGDTENAPSQTGGGAIKVSRGTGATAWIAATTTGDPGQNWPRIMYKSTSADAGDYGEWEESWHTGNLKFEWNNTTKTLNIITQ